MARVFITGSADGLGKLTAKALIQQDHDVVLHARNEQRATDAMRANPQAKAVVTGDLSDIEETKNIASEVNKLGTFDAVIHNAGVYQVSSRDIFAVNTLAPYILTALIHKPRRLIYLTSGMHSSGHFNADALSPDRPRVSYSDSKLHVVMLCMAVARRWSDVFANAVNPGWVPTKMGGRGAPDDLHKGYETQVWLAVSNEPAALTSGNYFFHKQQRRYNPEAADVALQEEFFRICHRITGVSF